MDEEDVLDEVVDILESVDRSDASQQELLTAVRNALGVICGDEEDVEEDEDEDDEEDDVGIEEEDPAEPVDRR
jgi:hypothetical protein